MKLFKIIGIALLGLCLQTSYAATTTPESVVKTVADWYLKDGGVGLPDPNKEPVKSSFGDKLKGLITQAQIEQDKQMKAHPDEKPAFVEMPLVSGVPEPLGSYRIVKVQKTRQSARVSLEWRYKHETGVVNTQMLLVPQRGQWVIVDILHDDGKTSVVKVLQDPH